MRTTLLADIGGTNARFALLSGDRLGSLTTLAVAAHASFDHAMRFFIEHHAAEVRPDAAILAAAGPVERGRCQLTNSSWVIDATDLQHRHGLGVVDVINDHEAIAWSLPELGPADTLLIGSDTPVRGAPLAVRVRERASARQPSCRDQARGASRARAAIPRWRPRTNGKIS